MYRAMEAWLKKRGHDKLYGGYNVIRSGFVDAAPDHLRSRVISCLAKVNCLEYELEGGFDFKEPVPQFSEWKDRAYAYTDECEETVRMMEADMNEPKGRE